MLGKATCPIWNATNQAQTSAGVLCSPARTYVDVLQAGAGLGERPQASVRDLPFSKGEDEADRQRQHGWMR